MTKPIQDHEYPDPDEEDDGKDTSPCPHCGEPIFEDAVQCPRCGEYVTFGSTSILAGKPAWFVVLALLGVVSVIVLCLFWTPG